MRKLNQEFYENPDRINKIVDWIIANHDRKTHNKQFSAMLCVSNINTLITYYEIFKNKSHDLRVITVFTPSINEADEDANGLIGEADFDLKNDNSHSRDQLGQFIADYNQMYQTQHSVKDSRAFYAYYKDVSKWMKDRDSDNFLDQERADILLVVNMYLTGFDVKKLNTIYVDKNLKYHGLIQAYSRTNRILGELKSQGNIVCFRNLKDNTDQAIALFSNPNAKEEIFIQPLDYYIEQFNQGVEKLKEIASSPDQVNQLIREDDQLEFVKSFRNLMRLLNVSKSFTEFDFSNLNIDEQIFNNYRSKYLDIYDKTRSRNEEEKPSIVTEIDFELELIHRDDINVAYILNLLAKLQRDSQDDDSKKADYEKQKANILELLNKETQLRSKRDIITKFIDIYLPSLQPEEKLEQVFSEFWNQERMKALKQLCIEENLNEEMVNQMINTYHFTGKNPLRETVLNACYQKPKALERKKVYDRVVDKLVNFIQRFDDDLGYIEDINP